MNGVTWINVDSCFLEFSCKAGAQNIAQNQHLTLFFLELQVSGLTNTLKIAANGREIYLLFNQFLGFRYSASFASADPGSGCQL